VSEVEVRNGPRVTLRAPTVDDAQPLFERIASDPYRVSAYCHVDNTGSARVLERSGLALEGRLVRYGMFPNLSSEPQDCLLFGKALR